MRNLFLNQFVEKSHKSSKSGRKITTILVRLFVLLICLSMFLMVSCNTKTNEEPPVVDPPIIEDNEPPEEGVDKDPTFATRALTTKYASQPSTVNIRGTELGVTSNSHNAMYYGNIKLTDQALALARNGHLAMSANANVTNSGGYTSSYIGLYMYGADAGHGLSSASLSSAVNAYAFNNDKLSVNSSYLLRDKVDLVGNVRNRFNLTPNQSANIIVPGKSGNDAAAGGFSRDITINPGGSTFNASSPYSYPSGQDQWYGAATGATARVYVLFSGDTIKPTITDVNVTFAESYGYQNAKASLQGSGTSGSPYIIANADNLLTVSSLCASNTAYLSKHYKVTANIDMSSKSYIAPIGFNSPFTGVFDGGNYVIKGIKQVSTATDNFSYYGLFGRNSGTIKNLILSGGNFSYTHNTANGQVGSITGSNSGTIENCLVLDTIVNGHPTDAGSRNPIYGTNTNDNDTNKKVINTFFVSGSATDNTITSSNKANRGYILKPFELSSSVYYLSTANQFVLLSYMVNNNITNSEIPSAYSYARTSLKFSIKNDIDLTGHSFTSIGTSSYPFNSQFDFANKTVTSNIIDGNSDFVGGIFGVLSGTVSNLNIKGSINIPSNTAVSGGVVGKLNNGAVLQNIKSSVTITSGGTYVGGIVGENHGSISNVSFDSIVNQGSLIENAKIGGIVGLNSGSITTANSNADLQGGNNSIGGIAGKNTATLKNVFVSNLRSSSNTASVGYLVGENTGSIIHSYAVVTSVQNNLNTRSNWNTIGAKVVLESIDYNSVTFGFSSEQFFLSVNTISDGYFVRWVKNDSTLSNAKTFKFNTSEGTQNSETIKVSFENILKDELKLKDSTYGDNTTTVINSNDLSEDIFNYPNTTTYSFQDLSIVSAGAHSITVTFRPEGYAEFTKVLNLTINKADFTFNIGKDNASEIVIDYGTESIDIKAFMWGCDETVTFPFTLEFIRNGLDGRSIENIITYNSVNYNPTNRSYNISILSSTFDMVKNTDEQISITAKVAASSNYNSSSTTATLVVNRIEQNLTFGDAGGSIENNILTYNYSQNKRINLVSTNADKSMTNDFIMSYKINGNDINIQETIAVQDKILGNGDTRIEALILNSTYLFNGSIYENAQIQINAKIENSQNYIGKEGSIYLDIQRIEQQISFENINEVYERGKIIKFNATTNADSTVERNFIYSSSNSTVVTIDGSRAEILNSTADGNPCTITASLAESRNYLSATKIVDLNIAKADLTISGSKFIDTERNKMGLLFPYADKGQAKELNPSIMGISHNGDDSSSMNYIFSYYGDDNESSKIFKLSNESGYKLSVVKSSYSLETNQNSNAKFRIYLPASRNYNETETTFYISVTRQNVYLTVFNGQGKVYDGKTANDIEFAANIDGASTINKLVGDDTNKLLSEIFTGALGLPNNTINSGSYNVIRGTLKAENYDFTTVAGQYEIRKRPISIDTNTINTITREYNASNIISYDLISEALKDFSFVKAGGNNSGLLEQDNDPRYLSINFGAGTLKDKSVGNNKPVTISIDGANGVKKLTLSGEKANNYTLSEIPNLRVNITAKEITATQILARDKTYDGRQDNIELYQFSGGTLQGILPNDKVLLNSIVVNGRTNVGTASVSDANVGDGKVVILNSSSLTIGGEDAGNYTLKMPENITVRIIQNQIKIIDVKAEEREYDGTKIVKVFDGSLTAGLSNVNIYYNDLSKFTFRFKGEATVDNPDAYGISKEVHYEVELYDLGSEQIARNYKVSSYDNVSVIINKKQLSVKNPTFDTKEKIYDGTSNFNGKITVGDITDEFARQEFAEKGFVITAKGSFKQNAVGNGLDLTVSYELDTASSSNYKEPKNYVESGFSINPRNLTIKENSFVLSKYEKVYDGDDTYELGSRLSPKDGFILSPAALENIVKIGVNTDRVEIISYVIKFNNKNVNDANLLTVKFTLTGSHALNYILEDFTFAKDVRITPYSLLINYGEMSMVYDGGIKGVEGTITPLKEDIVNLTFTYSQSDTTVDPIERGEYKIIPSINNPNYKIDGASMNKVLRITKNIVKGLTFDNIEHTYNKNFPTIKVNGLQESLDKVDITYTYFKMINGSESAINLAEIINVGIYYARAAFEVKDPDNYEDIEDMLISITISPKDINLIYANDENLTYAIENDQAKEHIVDVSISQADIIMGDSAYLEIVRNSNKAINAGKYEIISSLLDRANGNVLENYRIANNNKIFIVKKATVDDSLLSFENKTITYDGNAHKITLDESKTLPSEVTVRYLYPNGMSDGIKDVGEYNIIAEFTIANVGTLNDPIYNYETISNKTAKLIINPKEITIDLTYGQLVYTGSRHSISTKVTGHIGLEDINLVGLENADNILNAGEYIINLKLIGDKRNNYIIQGDTSRKVVVEKATWNNIGLTSKTLTYDGKAHSLELNNALPTDGQIIAKFSNANSFTNVGEHYVTVDFEVQNLGQDGKIIKNYNEIPSDTEMLKINSFVVENVIFSDYSGLTYDRNNHTIKVEYYNEAGSLVLGEVSFSGNGIVGAVSEIKNAGTYTASLVIRKNGIEDNNYDLDNLSPITVEIAKATITANFEDHTIIKIYNGYIQSVMLLQHNELMANTDLKIEYSNHQKKNVGEYETAVKITPKDEYINNYNEIAEISTKFIINPAAIKLNYIGTEGLVYDGRDKIINFEIASGVLALDSVRIILTNNTFKYAGTYNVEASIVDIDTNYYLENPQISIIVDKQSLSDYELVNKTVTYDGKAHTLELNKPLPSDGQVRIVIENGEHTDVLSIYGGQYGSYNITAIFVIEEIIVEGIPISNYYNMASTSGLLTIKPLEVKVDYYNYSNLKYNGNEQHISATYKDINNQVINANLSYNSITIDANNYIAYANIADTNYIPTTLTSRLSFKIGKKPLEVNVVRDTSYTYNGKKQVINAQLSGILAQDENTVYPIISYGATSDSMFNAGVYDITIGVNNKNYEITPDKAQVKIVVYKVRLFIGVENLVVKYGEDINFTYIYNGFIHGETSDNLSVKPKITLATREPGYYSVTPYGASSSNYDMIYRSGLLTINSLSIEDSVNNEGKLEGSFSPETVLKIYKTENPTGIKPPKNFEVSGQYTFELVKDGNLVELPSDETITVRIKLNDKILSRDEFKVAYANESGDLVYVENSRIENGYLVFETDELRTYTLLTATNYTFIFVVIGLVFVLVIGGVMFILFKKKY